MTSKEENDLKTAIREFYSVEPLKQDLAKRVADRAFAHSRRRFKPEDFLRVAAGIVCLGMLGYVFGFTQPGAAGPALLFMFIVIPILAGAGWKEFNLLSRRLSALE